MDGQMLLNRLPRHWKIVERLQVMGYSTAVGYPTSFVCSQASRIENLVRIYARYISYYGVRDTIKWVSFIRPKLPPLFKGLERNWEQAWCHHGYRSTQWSTGRFVGVGPIIQLHITWTGRKNWKVAAAFLASEYQWAGGMASNSLLLWTEFLWAAMNFSSSCKIWEFRVASWADAEAPAAAPSTSSWAGSRASPEGSSV